MLVMVGWQCLHFVLTKPSLLVKKDGGKKDKINKKLKKNFLIALYEKMELFLAIFLMAFILWTSLVLKC